MKRSHKAHARSILSYYDKYPEPIEAMARRIGYRIRPSFLWTFQRDGAPGLVIGLANDGIAAKSATTSNLCNPLFIFSPASELLSLGLWQPNLF